MINKANTPVPMLVISHTRNTYLYGANQVNKRIEFEKQMKPTR